MALLSAQLGVFDKLDAILTAYFLIISPMFKTKFDYVYINISNLN